MITPTDANPVSSRATGLTMINKRIMPYCINMLDGNIACMSGAESGFSGYYSAINPQLQVDLLDTTTMTFSAGARPGRAALANAAYLSTPMCCAHEQQVVGSFTARSLYCAWMSH